MSVGIKDVKAWLGNDLAELVDFTVERNSIIVKTREFMYGDEGKEKWSQINSILKDQVGECWVSKGKDSHWRVPLEAAQTSDVENLSFHCPYCNKLINVKVE